ncbi:hypothetical protein SAMN05216228_106412 [Rhizobium tibeticum]|uniref:Uncharacterized protein n=1 Tax=Rhizobium tibeticum TaxID=501024 RepID=A0A1H8WGK3_9HYPH|nr:hypothetical protein RTCCBAU85039_6544 [Rhizobium tibeticum]SEP26824.1 hypothetical protein SAMN05216228_106412 [Rhizobium tibeticum]
MLTMIVLVSLERERADKTIHSPPRPESTAIAYTTC